MGTELTLYAPKPFHIGKRKTKNCGKSEGLVLQFKKMQRKENLHTDELKVQQLFSAHGKAAGQNKKKQKNTKHVQWNKLDKYC